MVNEDIQEEREGPPVILRGGRRLVGGPPREDALTHRPLDLQKEEQQRQHHTTQWLEDHFGSDSGRYVDKEVN